MSGFIENRKVALVRELTKKNEEVITGGVLNVLNKLDSKDYQGKGFEKNFQSINPELRANTLRNFIDSYDRLEKNGIESSIPDFLLHNAELGLIDDELPSID